MKMIKMKTYFFKSIFFAAVVTTFFIFQITSCDKDELITPPIENTIEGFWIGIVRLSLPLIGLWIN